MAKEDSKSWWESKAVIGAILMLIVVILRALGRQGEAEAIEIESVGITEWGIAGRRFGGIRIGILGQIDSQKRYYFMNQVSEIKSVDGKEEDFEEKIMHHLINAGIKHWVEMFGIKDVFDSIDSAKKDVMDEYDQR